MTEALVRNAAPDAIVSRARDWKQREAEAAAAATEYLEAWRAERRSSLENPASPLSFPAEWLLDMYNGGRTDSGIRVSELTALQVSTVYACVNLIASALGFLPLHVMELVFAKDKRAGKRIAYDHALYDMLRYEPNPEMTACTFRKTRGVHALLWGNSYAEIERDVFGRTVAIWPLNPARTRPRRDRNGQLFYETSDNMRVQTDPNDPGPGDAHQRFLHSDDVLHVPGLSLDGRVGQSTIWLSRQVMGLALAAEKFGAKFFGNGARPGGILEYPGGFKDDASREKFRNSWQEAQGGENAGRTAVLEKGMTWKAQGIANNESQFLETRQFQRQEICGIFAVPPHMIGDTDKTNRANTQQIGVEFVTFTLSPWLEADQQEYKRKLFPSVGRNAGRFIAHFETRKLTMPDAASLKDFIATVRQWGVGSTNDVREVLDMNPIDEPWADQCWQPINMGVAGQPPPALKPGARPPESEGAQP